MRSTAGSPVALYRGKRIEPRKTIHPACYYCREPYKEYEDYPGCCSSCHAPPTDVYPYFRSMPPLKRYYTRGDILRDYSQPRYVWTNDKYRELSSWKI